MNFKSPSLCTRKTSISTCLHDKFWGYLSLQRVQLTWLSNNFPLCTGFHSKHELVEANLTSIVFHSRWFCRFFVEEINFYKKLMIYSRWFCDLLEKLHKTIRFEGPMKKVDEPILYFLIQIEWIYISMKNTFYLFLTKEQDVASSSIYFQREWFIYFDIWH